jgi:hypothetical protein
MSKNNRVVCTVEEIDPDTALKYLDKSRDEVNNRPVNKGHLEFLEKEMQSGRWKVNGQTIKFDDEGFLIDGQHRLWAVVNTNTTIRTAIARGIDRAEALSTIDTGQRIRSFGEVLMMDNQKKAEVRGAPILAAATTFLANYKDRSFFVTRKRRPVSLLMSILDDNMGLVDSLDVAQGLRGIYPSISLASCCHYIFQQRNPNLADQFFNSLGLGTDLKINDPVLALRERILAYKIKKERRSIDHIAYITFRAWLFAEAGLPLKVLQWRRQATNERPADAFPYLDDYPKDSLKLREALKKRSKLSI